MWESWPDQRTLRLFTPPRPVVVDMVRLDPNCGRPYSAAPEGVSLRVRASGARIEPTMPARQLAWLQLSNGLWRAICELTVSSANRVSSMTLTLWVPPEAIRLQEKEDNT